MKYSTSRNQLRYKIRKFFRQLTIKDFQRLGWIFLGVTGWIAFFTAMAVLSALL